MHRTGLPSSHSKLYYGKEGYVGKPHLPFCCLPSSSRSHAPGWYEGVMGSKSHSSITNPLSSFHEHKDAFLNPEEIWLPGLITILVVRIPAHELALLLGIMSHSFQVVPGVEVRLWRGGRAICQVSSPLSSLLSKHKLPERPYNVCEKSPCQIPGISLSHYVTLDKVTEVLRAFISLVKIENSST